MRTHSFIAIVFGVFLLSSCNSHKKTSNVDSNLKRADSLLTTKDFGEAFLLYQGVYVEDSSNTKAIYGCGLSCLKSANLLRAIHYFDKFLSKKQDAMAYLYRGVAYDYLDSLQQAEKDYSMAIALNPKTVNAYNNRGLLEIKFKKYDEAKKDLTTSLSLYSNQPECYTNLGLLYSNLGNKDEAVKYHSKAISLDSSNGWYYYNRGVCYFYLKYYEKAIDDLTRAINFNPGSGHLYKNRALAFYKKGNSDRACEDLAKAIQLNDLSAKEYFEKICRGRDKKQVTI